MDFMFEYLDLSDRSERQCYVINQVSNSYKYITVIIFTKLYSGLLIDYLQVWNASLWARWKVSWLIDLLI